MAPYWKKHTKGKQEKALVAKDGSTILRVEPYMHFGKHTLAPFSNDGLPIYLPSGIKKEKKLYTLSAVRDLLNHLNSEFCRRPAIGLSEKSASINDFLKLLEENPDPNKALDAFMEFFKTPDGKKFVAASDYFNTNNEHSRNAETSAQHLEEYFDFFSNHGEDAEKIFRNGMLVSTRMLLACASGLECASLATNVKAWAKKIKPVKEQSKAMRAWIDDPNNLKKAKKALLAAIGDNEKKPKRNKQSKLNSDASSSSDAKAKKKRKRKNSSSDGSANSDSEDSDKKKRKDKAKKAKSSDEKSDSSASKESDAKKKKKTDKEGKSQGKDAKKKKVKKQSSNSDSSSKKPKKSAKKDKKDKEDKADANAKLVEFRKWSKSDVDILSNNIYTKLTEVGSNVNGKYPYTDFEELVQSIPESIFAYVPDLQLKLTAAKDAGEDLANTTAKSVLQALVRLLAEVDDAHAVGSTATASK